MYRDLLSDWYSSSILLSSPLLIKPTIERQKIDFIYNTLLTAFPPKYFQLKIGEEKSFDKINWLRSLMLNGDQLGCIEALYDVCVSIKYLNTQNINLQSEFKQLINNPNNLRAFFFELFIYQILDRHKIPNEKKPYVNDKPLDGTCNIYDRKFLFECTQVYLPKAEDLYFIQRILSDFWSWSNAKKAAVGMIGTIRFNRPLSRQHRISFGNKIKELFTNLAQGQYIGIDYLTEDNFGVFKVISWNEEVLQQTFAEKNYDILYYQKPTENLVVGKPAHFKGEAKGNFSLLQSQWYTKLETILKSKKKQHRDSELSDKIIFIYSESFPNLQMGLFENERMFDAQKVEHICKKVCPKVIVCFVRRNYYSDKPVKMIDIVYPAELAIYANFLRHILN